MSSGYVPVAGFRQVHVGQQTDADGMGRILEALRARLPGGDVDLTVTVVPHGFHIVMAQAGRR